MTATIFPRLALGAAFAVLLPFSLLRADEPKQADGLTDFTSKAGRFSIRLPGKPQYEATTVGDAKETQHQFKLGTEQGAYLISYQENPNLQGSSPEELVAALKSGRDRLLKTFQGELVESKTMMLGKAHPGLDFRITIPAANGEARCRFYMVGTRLYQIMAIGLPDFVASQQSTRVIESFRLLP